MKALEAPAPAGERGGHRTSLAHIPSLDGVRGAAIALVLAGHGFDPFLPGAAAAGVGLFFVLSGFLITTILLTEHARSGRISLRRFFARRALRLFPALYVMLALYSIWLLTFGEGADQTLGWHSVWTGGLYVSNWSQALQYPALWYLGHTWSLATEEQFYLVWPAALTLLLTITRRRIAALVFAGSGVVALAIARSVLHRVSSPIRENLYFSPVTWADGLLIGCILGMLYSWRLLPQRPRLLLPLTAAGGYLLLVVWFGSVGSMFDGGVTLMALANATIVVGAITHPIMGKALSVRPLRFLGRISYGAYLWHLPIIAGTLALFPGGPRWATGSAAVAATTLVATTSYALVERPFLSLKERASRTERGPSKTPPRESSRDRPRHA